MWSYRKEIHKLHTIGLIPDPACSLGIDVAFIVDYTGSMGSVIEEIKSSIGTIINALEEQSGTNSYRIALLLSDEVSKGELPNYFNSPGYTSLPIEQKAVREDGATTNQYTTAMEVFGTLNNNTEFISQLNKINTTAFPLGSGVGGPEPLDEAIDLIVNNNFANGFKFNVAKYILLFTDALPSGNDDAYTQEDTDRIQALTQNCISKDIKVIVVGNGSNNIVWQDMATSTGGSYSNSYDGQTISAQLSAGCNQQTAPIARAGADQSVEESQGTVNINGSNSSDYDGTIVSYLWAIVSDARGATIANPNAAVTSISGITAGSYTVRLTVTDNDGLQGTDLMTIQVSAGVEMSSYSYEGVYETNDPAHPNGGSLDYVDINGNTQSLTFMWAGNCQTFSSQSAPTNIVAAVPCTP
jgi:hypothetical protein